MQSMAFANVTECCRSQYSKTEICLFFLYAVWRTNTVHSYSLVLNWFCGGRVFTGDFLSFYSVSMWCESIVFVTFLMKPKSFTSFCPTKVFQFYTKYHFYLLKGLFLLFPIYTYALALEQRLRPSVELNVDTIHSRFISSVVM